MQRIFICISILAFPCFSFAGSNYQVDLILFAQPQVGAANNDPGLNAPFLPISKSAITLKNAATQSAKPYQLLSASKSSLRNEYYLLNRRHTYQILGHYSWVQPGKNQSTVALPLVNHNGWKMQGTVRVRQSNYYLLDTDIQLSPPSNPQFSYTVEQKQRLKDSVVYYLDHPQLGILVKVHKLG